jgi:GNAT superfamily N-acetyltransferase
MSSQLRITTMRRNQLDFAIDLAAAEGWNPGLHDADAFYAADPEGFLIATLDDTPVGCISAVNYGNVFGFIGFYIVVPQHRGKGYGMQLWQAAMARLQDVTVGLDGVPAQQENYQKSGFTLAYSNIRYRFINRHLPVDRSNLLPIALCSLEEISCYDGHCFPAGRIAFLRQWLQLPQSWGYAIKIGNQIVGYGCIRTCRSGYKIGPLFADSPLLARQLFFGLCHEVPQSSEIFFDIPEVNPAAMALAQELAMEPTFRTARMYTGAPPQIELQRVYGVTTFELG